MNAIPACSWYRRISIHGWKNIGTTEASIINMPSSQYDYDSPDALDLPYDSPRAAEIVPFRW